MVTQACLSTSISSNHTDPACEAEPHRAGRHCHPFIPLSLTPLFFHVFVKDVDSSPSVSYFFALLYTRPFIFFFFPKHSLIIPIRHYPSVSIL